MSKYVAFWPPAPTRPTHYFTALGEKEEAAEKDSDKIKELNQMLFKLRGEIGAGRHVPPGVRVLTMCTNPAQNWADLHQAALDRLKQENTALLQGLSTLETRPRATTNTSTDNTIDSSTDTSTPTTTELVPRASWAAVCQEKVQLQDELRQKEKRMLCLRQVFAAKTAEFREAPSAILGVKLAFYDNGEIRVTSQYDLSAARPHRCGCWGGCGGGEDAARHTG